MPFSLFILIDMAAVHRLYSISYADVMLSSISPGVHRTNCSSPTIEAKWLQFLLKIIIFWTIHCIHASLDFWQAFCNAYNLYYSPPIPKLEAAGVVIHLQRVELRTLNMLNSTLNKCFELYWWPQFSHQKCRSPTLISSHHSLYKMKYNEAKQKFYVEWF